MPFSDIWTGAISTDWNTAGNWNIGANPAAAPPTSNDSATVNAGTGAVTITGAGALQSATFSLSSSGAGAINLTGTFYTGYNSGSLGFAALVNLSGQIYDYGAATFGAGAELSGGTVAVTGAATFGGGFTVKNAELDLSASTTATLTTLTLIGATTLSGDITATTLSDASATSLTLGTGVFDISGSSSASPALLPALTIKGDVTLMGVFNSTAKPAPSLTVLGGAQLYLDAGDALIVATATFAPSGYVSLTDGTLTVTGDASFGTSLYLTGAGSFTVDGTLTTNGGSINAANSSRVEIDALNGSGGGLTLTADTTSAIEIGNQNVAAAGSITIDSGVSFTESGNFSAPIIVINGAITVASGKSLTLDGTSQSRGLTGSGKLNINTGSSLTLDNVDPGTSDLVTINFAQVGGLLYLPSGDFDAQGNFEPVITGFGATDVIEYGGTATSATYAGGYLSLYNGANLVAKFNIGSGYTGDTFSTVPIAGSYTQIDLAGVPKAAPAGTTTADDYTWVGPVAGYWSTLANWDNVTTGHNPAALAPGKTDSVTIGAAAGGAAQVLVGNGNAAALTLDGETLLDGVFNVGAGGLALASSASAYLYTGSSLNVAGNAAFAAYAGVTLNGGAFSLTGASVLTNSYANTFLIENGGAMSAIGLVGYYSNYTVLTGSKLTAVNVSDTSGAGSTFNATGGAITVKGVFTSSGDGIYARSGGTVQLAGLVEDASGRGVTLEVYDATSSIEIGTAGGVAGGTIAIDAGKTLTEAGYFSATTVVVAGALDVGAGQTLSVTSAVQDQGGIAVLAGGTMSVNGALTLTGNVTIGANAKFTQNSGLSGAGKFTIDAGAKLTLGYDPAGSAATIAFAGAGAQLALDTTDLSSSNAFVTAISGFTAADVIDFTDYANVVTAAHYSAGTLSLYNGATVVGALSLGAGYTDTFSVLPIGGSTYQIDYLGGGTSAAPAGTTTADDYTWVGAVAGNWKTPSNWDNVTTGHNPASLAPGKTDSVTIGAAAGGAAQVLVGNGNAAALTLDGETLLDGVFNVGAGGLALASSASAYLYTGSSLNVAGNAAFAAYAGVTLNGGAFSLTGASVLTNSYANTFLVENGGAMSAVGLVGYYSNYTVLTGSKLTAVNVSDTSGAGSTFNATGGEFMVKGVFTSSSDGIYARSGGTVQLAGLAEDASGRGVTLEVYDATSSIEIGTAGGVAGGTIAIDAGKTLTEAGYFSATAVVVAGALDVGAGQTLSVTSAVQDQGGIAVLAGGTMSVNGALTLTGNVTVGVGGKFTQNSGLSGAGKFTIDAGAKLTLGYDPAGSAATIAFAGAGAQLALDTTDLSSSNAFVTAISGFTAADVIDFTDYANVVTAAHYSAGTLSLYNGATVVGALSLGAGYTDTFSVLPIGGSTYQIDYLGGGTSAAPAGTTTADDYTWVGAVAGNWKTPSNWDNVTTGHNPASLAPGKTDSVTIGAAAGGAAQVLVGNGNAAALTLDGETLLDGVFNVGAGGLALASSASAYLYTGSSLNVAGNAAFAAYAGVTLNGGAFSLTGASVLTNSYANTFLVENGGAMSAVGLVGYYSNYTVLTGSKLTAVNVSDTSGAGSTFNATGGEFMVKGVFTSSSDGIYARSGGTVQLAGLAEDASGRGVTLEVYDATSSIEIGTAGGVAGGTIAIDAGKSVTEQGAFDATTVAVAGALDVGAGQSLTIQAALQVSGAVVLLAGATLNQYGPITGSGKITIDSGAKLSLVNDSAGSAIQIAFSGVGGRLALDSSALNTSNAFAPVLTGFTNADIIDFYYGPSSLTSAHSAGGVLSLYSGANVLATFNIGAGFADFWTVTPLGGSTEQVNYEGRAPATAVPGGTSTGDAFQWVGNIAGFWNVAGNWDDTTLGQNPAAVAPGAKDTVTFAAAPNGEAQVVDGAGAAFGMTVEGETLLIGVFNVDGTGARGGLTATTSASVVVDAGSSLTDAGDATFNNYAGATINGGAMTVHGTFYGGYGSAFLIENAGSLNVSQIVDYYSGFTINTGATVTDSGNVSDSGTGSASSAYTVNAATFIVKGTFVSTGDSLYAQNGGEIQLAALQEDVHNSLIYLYVTGASSIEIGSAGAAAASAITLDAGISVTEGGSFNASSIVENGALTVAAGQTLTLSGALGGSGSLTLDAGSTLVVDGASASGANTIAFSGAGGTLQFADVYGLPNGMTLTGWIAGENLEVRGVTDAAYVGGSLVLFSNGATVGSLKVGASYAGDAFDVVPLNNGYSQITLGPSWLNPVSANFATAADWSAGIVPGAADSAAISTTGTYTVSITANTTVRSIEETASGATLSIAVGDTLSLSGASNINGAVTGSGALSLTGGATTFDGSGSITVQNWTLAGAGASIVAAQTLAYSGSFQAGAGTTVTVSGGNFSLTGPTGLTDVTVNGSQSLLAQGATSVTGLTIAGTATFKDAATLTQSGGAVTVGDSVGDVAKLSVLSTGVWDIVDNSGLAEGSSTASSIGNSGLFEKTGGGGTSTVAPAFTNALNVLVSSGTLDFEAAVTGTGTDTLQGASTTLEFDSTLASSQTIDFSAAGETLNLTDALGYGGSLINSFIAGDHVDLNGSWTFSSFSENAGGTIGTLTLASGANMLALEFGGSFTQTSFSIGTGSTTVIGHT